MPDASLPFCGGRANNVIHFLIYQLLIRTCWRLIFWQTFDKLLICTLPVIFPEQPSPGLLAASAPLCSCQGFIELLARIVATIAKVHLYCACNGREMEGAFARTISHAQCQQSQKLQTGMAACLSDHPHKHHPLFCDPCNFLRKSYHELKNAIVLSSPSHNQAITFQAGKFSVQIEDRRL